MTNLSVQLQMPQELAAELNKQSGLLAFVHEAFPVIDSSEVAGLAAAQRKECLTIAKAIKDKMEKYISPAAAIIEQAKGDFKPAICNAQAAAEHLGAILLMWDQKERARVDAERRAKEEEARKARAKADQEAAQARAKAQAEAAERNRQAREALEAQRKALVEGNAAAAKKAAEEQAKREAQALAAQEQAEALAAKAHAEAEATIQASAPVEQAKVSGFGSRKNWKAILPSGYFEADVKDGVEMALQEQRAAIVAIASELQAHPEYASYLTLNWSALHQHAKAVTNNFNVPGLKARNIPVGVSR